MDLSFKRALAIGCCILTCYCRAQDISTPSSFTARVDKKASLIDHKLSDQSRKYLNKLSHIEARLLQKMETADPSVMSQLPPADYHQWASRLQTASSSPDYTGNTYIGHLDTLQTTIKFLQTRLGDSLSLSQLNQTAARLSKLQSHFDQSNLIDQYIVQRRQQIAQMLGRYNTIPKEVTRAFTQFKETSLYYRQQVDEYKKLLGDQQKMEQKTLTVLNKLPAFQQFMAQHSMLSSMFRLPGNSPSDATALGLQLRDQVQQILQQQVSGAGQGGAAAVQQQMSAAQSQIEKMQTNLSKYGAGGSDPDISGFKPDQQKTRTFWKRLSYGTNLQLAKSSTYFPATGSLALSLGYKISDNGTVGIGAAYDIGLGSSWSHIHFSSQGIGLRSFIDWKIKKSIYLMGGYERNYLMQFTSFSQLANKTAWQNSGLVGLEKKYRVSSKLQGNIQLLWDFLSAYQTPKAQPILFRIGYNF